jgi:hypothetical protein
VRNSCIIQLEAFLREKNLLGQDLLQLCQLAKDIHGSGRPDHLYKIIPLFYTIKHKLAVGAKTEKWQEEWYKKACQLDNSILGQLSSAVVVENADLVISSDPDKKSDTTLPRRPT